MEQVLKTSEVEEGLPAQGLRGGLSDGCRSSLSHVGIVRNQWLLEHSLVEWGTTVLKQQISLHFKSDHPLT